MAHVNIRLETETPAKIIHVIYVGLRFTDKKYYLLCLQFI